MTPISDLAIRLDTPGPLEALIAGKSPACALQETAPTLDPIVGLYLGSSGGPREVGVFLWTR